MSQTYDFMVALARTYAPPPARLLDFGCGGGEIVDLASAAGFEAYGIDTFEDMWEQYEAAARGRGNRILRVPPGEPLPFEDGRFDLVVSNQVFEHISDLAPVGSELARLLRPGGTLITIFPTRKILIEPHLKAPFVHWFTPGSASQRAALRVSHALRLCNRPDQERQSWIRDEQGHLQKISSVERQPRQSMCSPPGLTFGRVTRQRFFAIVFPCIHVSPKPPSFLASSTRYSRRQHFAWQMPFSSSNAALRGLYCSDL
jgi:SAM-dependent methyltransferase